MVISECLSRGRADHDVSDEVDGSAAEGNRAAGAEVGFREQAHQLSVSERDDGLSNLRRRRLTGGQVLRLDESLEADAERHRASREGHLAELLVDVVVLHRVDEMLEARAMEVGRDAGAVFVDGGHQGPAARQLEQFQARQHGFLGQEDAVDVQVALRRIVFGYPEVRIVSGLQELLGMLLGDCGEGHWPLLSF